MPTQRVSGQYSSNVVAYLVRLLVHPRHFRVLFSLAFCFVLLCLLIHWHVFVFPFHLFDMIHG